VIQRILRLILHLGGWILTPLVAVLAAALGATITLFVAQSFSTKTALVLATIGGLLGATGGMWVWLRFLRRSPAVRDVLSVTPQGVPTADALAEVIGTDIPESEPDK
jgi:hypothetical protein